MKTNIIITIITGLLTLTACNGTTTPKTEKEKQIERYEAAFRNYVATDFDDPSALMSCVPNPRGSLAYWDARHNT